MEFPLAVERLVIGGCRGHHLSGLLSGGKMKHVGLRLLLAQRESLGRLPFVALRGFLPSVVKTFQEVFLCREVHTYQKAQ